MLFDVILNIIIFSVIAGGIIFFIVGIVEEKKEKEKKKREKERDAAEQRERNERRRRAREEYEKYLINSKLYNALSRDQLAEVIELINLYQKLKKNAYEYRNKDKEIWLINYDQAEETLQKLKRLLGPKCRVDPGFCWLDIDLTYAKNELNKRQ